MMIVMVFVLSLLAIISMFGGSIIINMLVKRWWANLVLFLFIVLYVFYRTSFQLTVLDWTLLLLSCAGVILASIGYRSLRARGYRLFP